MRTPTTALAGLVLLSMLGACSGLLPKPAAAPAQLTLDDNVRAELPAPAPSRNPAAATLTLVVDTPRAASGYDSPLMAYRRGTPQIEYFAQHLWVDTPAHMLAPLLVRALQQGGAFRAVVQAPTSASGEWRLQTEGLRLHQDFSVQPSLARLDLRAVLVESSTRRVLATREFSAAAPAASEDPVAGSAAAAQAARKLAADLAAWCAQQAAAPR